jgi:hypothetical protein
MHVLVRYIVPMSTGDKGQRSVAFVLACISAGMLISFIGGCEPFSKREVPMVYLLLYEPAAAPSGHTDPKDATDSRKWARIDINGHPVVGRADSTWNINVTHLLRSGTNVVELDENTVIGFRSLTVERAIAPGRSERVLQLESTNKNAAEFTVALPKRDEPDELIATTERNRIKIKNDCLAELRSFWKVMEAKDYGKAVDMLLAPSPLRGSHMRPAEQLSQFREQILAGFESKDEIQLEPDWPNVQVVVGRRSVLMYSHWDEQTKHVSLFRSASREHADNENYTANDSALRMVCVRGKLTMCYPP